MKQILHDVTNPFAVTDENCTRVQRAFSCADYYMPLLQTPHVVKYGICREPIDLGMAEKVIPFLLTII